MESGLDGKESCRINKTGVLESEGLETNVDIEKLSNDVKDPDDAAELINRMDKTISIKKNKTLTIARKQGEIFKKSKTDNKFISTIKKFNISKATVKV